VKTKTAAPLIILAIIFALGHPSTSKYGRTAIIIDAIEEESDAVDRYIELLKQNNYQVEYVSGENVSIGFLKNIPPNHDIYIFRVHSTCINNHTWIFSGEEYRTDTYPLLQVTDLIHKARPRLGSKYYFAVSSEFIKQYNHGAFKNSVILMMGCEGMCYRDLAYAFCSEGASIYISWDGNVCLTHSENATQALLEAICVKRLPVIEAVNQVNNQIGSDQYYGSYLSYYTGE